MEKSITIVAVSDINLELTKFAIEKTLENIPFVEKVLFVSSGELLTETSFEYEHLKVDEPLDLYRYTIFMQKNLHYFIKTSHVLIVQYDGFATNKEYWDDKFLDYDYVGSVTHKNFPNCKQAAKNLSLETIEPEWFTLGGGFCLRSKKLLETLALDDFPIYWPINNNTDTILPPEDINICIVNRKKLEEHSIKFAPIELGLKFCTELLTQYDCSLGFHGWFLTPEFLPEEECLYYMSNLERRKIDAKSVECHFFKYNCIKKNYFSLLGWLITKHNFEEKYNQFLIEKIENKTN